ncbi:MAG: DUF4388 domain-containing protein, partial [Deltaproteobacteria bacterium]|nr:DUF4388 domain-containing protein [Deltaproteobacteria bacterium]
MAKKSLLLVDGDVRSLRVLEVSLRKAGYNLTTCGTAKDAIETLEYASPDLILSDTRLPGMDGFALVEALRLNSDWAAIPIMFLSSDTSVESKVRGLQLGVEDYLTKPIYTKEILARIHLALNRRERDSFARGRASLSKTRFTGSLEDMGLVDLLQTIDVSRKSGVLDLRGPQGHGTITFRDGQILDAELGRIHGERAVYRLLLWSEGDFDIEFRPVRSEAHIQTPTTGLLMEGMRRVDEWGRLLEQLPPLDSVLEVVEGELIPRLGEIPDELNPILKAVDGAHTLGEVVDNIAGDDLQTLSSLSKLYFEGVIQPSQRVRTLRPPDGTTTSQDENAVVGDDVELDQRIASSGRADPDGSGLLSTQSTSIVPPPVAGPEPVSLAIPAIPPPSALGVGTSGLGTATAKDGKEAQPSALHPPRAPSRDVKKTLLGPGFDEDTESLLAGFDSPKSTAPLAHAPPKGEPSQPPRASSVEDASATTASASPASTASSSSSVAPPSATAAASSATDPRSTSDREDPMAKKNKKNRGSERPSLPSTPSAAPPKPVETTAAVETKAKVEAPVARPEEKRPEEKRDEKREEATSNVIQFPAQAKRSVSQVAVNDDVVSSGREEESSRDDTQPRMKTEETEAKKAEAPKSEPPPKAEAKSEPPKAKVESDDDEDESPRSREDRKEKRKKKTPLTESGEMRALGTGDHAVVTEEFFGAKKKVATAAPEEHDDFADLQRSLEPMSAGSKQAMWATAGILLVGLALIGSYVYYQNVHMPQPVELGHAGPVEMPQMTGTTATGTSATGTTPPATTETEVEAPPATTETPPEGETPPVAEVPPTTETPPVAEVPP